jgi:hypothetical protein
MKTTYSKMVKASLFATVVAWAGLTSHAGEVTCKTGCCSQRIGVTAQERGYLNSPRGREEFPAFARMSHSAKSRSEKRLDRNSALARSPRFLEEHPELSRARQTATGGTVASVPLEVSGNRALAASPRAREEFPALRVKPCAIEEKLVRVCACALR